MRFDLVDLQLFVAVAEARSITHGAARSNLALASASARIKDLEQALGVALLTRGRRGVVLTAAGESLLDHARDRAGRCRDHARRPGGVCERCQGQHPHAGQHLGLSEHLPKALATFLREHPHINLDVEERESADIAQAIAGGIADLGFAAEHTLPDTIERFSFCDDRLVVGHAAAR